MTAPCHHGHDRTVPPRSCLLSCHHTPSSLPCHHPHVISPMSSLTCHLSNVITHMSSPTCHPPHFFNHIHSPCHHSPCHHSPCHHSPCHFNHSCHHSPSNTPVVGLASTRKIVGVHPQCAPFHGEWAFGAYFETKTFESDACPGVWWC